MTSKRDQLPELASQRELDAELQIKRVERERNVWFLVAILAVTAMAIVTVVS
jgi:hypothetical protein